MKAYIPASERLSARSSVRTKCTLRAVNEGALPDFSTMLMRCRS